MICRTCKTCKFHYSDSKQFVKFLTVPPYGFCTLTNMGIWLNKLYHGGCRGYVFGVSNNNELKEEENE